jgi:hypothetical protein
MGRKPKAAVKKARKVRIPNRQRIDKTWQFSTLGSDLEAIGLRIKQVCCGICACLQGWRAAELIQGAMVCKRAGAQQSSIM